VTTTGKRGGGGALGVGELLAMLVLISMRQLSLGRARSRN